MCVEQAHVGLSIHGRKKEASWRPNRGDVVGNTMEGEGRSRAKSDRPRLSESRLSVSGCGLDSKLGVQTL